MFYHPVRIKYFLSPKTFFTVGRHPPKIIAGTEIPAVFRLFDPIILIGRLRYLWQAIVLVKKRDSELILLFSTPLSRNNPVKAVH